jgi:uncharacterized protein YkwD
MSLRLLYKLAAVVAILALAASAAESVPRTTSASARSAAALPLVPISQAPHRPPRLATPSPLPVPSSPAAISVAQPAPPPPRVAVGSGQWGLINQDRAAAGLAPLRWSGCLAAIALQNATRMAAQGFISHTNGPTLDLGCHLGTQAGENVGYLSNGVNDAQMNAMFMASPEHRANILGPYHYVGVSWVVAPNGFAYVAVEFG